MKLNKLIGILAVAGLAAPGIASATNGYFSHGYGMKAKGMAGASTAMAVDAMGGANNPASMVWVGDRFDLGADWFRPIRGASRTGTDGNANNFSQNSDSNDFIIPEIGYNKMLNNDMSLGVSVYGNGGMNTDYQGSTTSQANCTGAGSSLNNLNALCGSGRLGMNLEQLLIAPTWAYKISQNHSIGVAPLFAYQSFSAEGLSAFGGLSTDKTKLTNQGVDTSTGWGVRVGWQGKLADSVTMGAKYSSKMDMTKFDRYKGLFAEQGDFDIPETYGVGIAVKATPTLTVALDYDRINYGDVKSINNTGLTTCTNGTSACSMGASAGLGFGWDSIDVWKLGFEYKYSASMTMRAGWNHGDNPVRNKEQTFNIIAPGIVTDHMTLGMTYALSPASELTVSYMHAFEQEQSGATSPNFAVGGTEKIRMSQDSLGIAYGMKY